MSYEKMVGVTTLLPSALEKKINKSCLTLSSEILPETNQKSASEYRSADIISMLHSKTEVTAKPLRGLEEADNTLSAVDIPQVSIPIKVKKTKELFIETLDKSVFKPLDTSRIELESYDYQFRSSYRLEGDIIGSKTINPKDSDIPIELVDVDYSRFLANAGMACVSLTFTGLNTGLIQPWRTGRQDNVTTASYLTEYLRQIVQKTLRKLPVRAYFVFEKHRNGAPHIHCFLMLLIEYREKVKSITEKLLGDNAVCEDCSLNYMLKRINKGLDDSQQNINLSPIARKTAKDKATGTRYNCSKIKDIQQEKQVFICTNKKYDALAQKNKEWIELSLARLFAIVQAEYAELSVRPTRRRHKELDENLDEIKDERPVVIKNHAIRSNPEAEQAYFEREKHKKERELRNREYEEEYKARLTQKFVKCRVEARPTEDKKTNFSNCNLELTEASLKAIKQYTRGQKTRAEASFLMKVIYSKSMKNREFVLHLPKKKIKIQARPSSYSGTYMGYPIFDITETALAEIDKLLDYEKMVQDGLDGVYLKKVRDNYKNKRGLLNNYGILKQGENSQYFEPSYMFRNFTYDDWYAENLWKYLMMRFYSQTQGHAWFGYELDKDILADLEKGDINAFKLL